MRWAKMPRLRIWVVGALLAAVARVAVPSAHGPSDKISSDKEAEPVAPLASLGSNLAPPAAVQTATLVKRDGRLTARPSPLVRQAAIKPLRERR